MIKQVYLILICLILLPSPFGRAEESNGGMRSETSTLENIYQEKASVFLNKLMNPEDYTLVITASIRNDELKLKEYHDTLDKKFLPGLIIQDPMGFNDAHNLLLDLKQKAEIQVILSEHVPADRDALVKEILKTNLHLNEENGDTITVVRASRNIASTDHLPPPEKLPELSSRMILFWIVLLVLFIAGVALWMFKRRDQQNMKMEEEKSVDMDDKESSEDEEHEKEEKEKEEPKIILPPLTAEGIAAAEAAHDALEMKTTFAKGELIKLIREYPNIVTKACEEFAARGKINDTVIFMEALGWELSKKLFKDLESRMWTRIGAALREREVDPTPQEVFDGIHVFHRFSLSFVLERTGRDAENPFTFIFQLTTSQRIDLLAHEKPENIALVAIYCSGPQMGELLKGLPGDKQSQVLLSITKIKQLPEAEVKASVDNFLMRLERIKADPSVHVDGPTLAADFMKSLPPAREEELYQSLVSGHPDEAEKLRRVMVMFQDIPYYPQEMIRKIIETFESEDIMKALVGSDQQFVESFLALLPVKKALMIQNDLYHMTDTPPNSLCAEYRRKITTKMEQEFEQQRFNVAEFWKASEVSSAAAAAEPTHFTEEETPAGMEVSKEVTSLMEPEKQEDTPEVFKDDPQDDSGESDSGNAA